VIGGGRLGLLQHHERKARVRSMKLKGGGWGLLWRELTERGGRSGGGFISGAVNGEVQYQSRQKAMGSGGASCTAH
jgi:hypothetical protein